jgi:hypothetical protein
MATVVKNEIEKSYLTDEERWEAVGPSGKMQPMLFLLGEEFTLGSHYLSAPTRSARFVDNSTPCLHPQACEGAYPALWSKALSGAALRGVNVCAF